MPRPPRLILSHSYYHIITRGNNKNIIFKKDRDYLHYLGLLKKYKQIHPFNLYHYCLMPNHVHLLIQTKSGSDFAVFAKKINLSYFYYYKNSYGWVGHFWQDRYKSQPVGKDSYFIQCGKYIELNPVRAGLIKSPEKYQWSSFRYYSQGENNDVITPDFYFEELGKMAQERQLKYSKLIIDDIVIQSENKKVWGIPSQRYNEQQKLNRKLKRRGA